ncbi:MAG: hypothetical protein DME09_19285 [Candidatus Rokuibacteriota bacterium]|nr:MAG: hypothetical protein DME09_19285 [Candidatus Rokubacteria bacterium]
MLKLPVSLRIVPRAPIEVGLEQEDRPVFLSNIGDQAKAVRLRRGAAASRMGCGGTEEYPVWDPTGQSEGA